MSIAFLVFGAVDQIGPRRLAFPSRGTASVEKPEYEKIFDQVFVICSIDCKSVFI